MYDNVIEYAQENLQTIIKRPAISAFSFCVPEFFAGSAFYIQNGMEYDRIYCGALVPKNRRFYFCNMLKIGGILVMPYASKVRVCGKFDFNNRNFSCFKLFEKTKINSLCIRYRMSPFHLLSLHLLISNVVIEHASCLNLKFLRWFSYVERQFVLTSVTTYFLLIQFKCSSK